MVITYNMTYNVAVSRYEDMFNCLLEYNINITASINTYLILLQLRFTIIHYLFTHQSPLMGYNCSQIETNPFMLSTL